MPKARTRHTRADDSLTEDIFNESGDLRCPNCGLCFIIADPSVHYEAGFYTCDICNHSFQIPKDAAMKGNQFIEDQLQYAFRWSNTREVQDDEPDFFS